MARITMRAERLGPEGGVHCVRTAGGWRAEPRRSTAARQRGPRGAGHRGALLSAIAVRLWIGQPLGRLPRSGARLTRFVGEALDELVDAWVYLAAARTRACGTARRRPSPTAPVEHDEVADEQRRRAVSGRPHMCTLLAVGHGPPERGRHTPRAQAHACPRCGPGTSRLVARDRGRRGTRPMATGDDP
jgi:hypothetical protein